MEPDDLPPCPERVRCAVAADAPRLFAHKIELHRVSPIGRLIPYDAGKVNEAIWQGIAMRNAMIGVIEGEHHALVASIGLAVQEWYWSTVPVLVMKWIFVSPLVRHEGAAYYRDLFRFAEWSREFLERDIAEKRRELGQPVYPLLLELAHDSSIDSAEDVEKKDRLFARFGRKVGSIYLAGLPEGERQPE